MLRDGIDGSERAEKVLDETQELALYDIKLEVTKNK